MQVNYELYLALIELNLAKFSKMDYNHFSLN